MTKERREDILLIAIVISVLLHVGLMFLVRAKVMAEVSRDDLRSHHREAMRVTDYKPIDDPVRMERIKDLLAVKEAPKAETEDLLKPADQELPDDVEDHWTDGVPAPEAPDTGSVEEIAAAPGVFETSTYDLAEVPPPVTPLVDVHVPAGRTLAAAPGTDGLAPTVAESWGMKDVTVEMPIPNAFEMTGAEKMSGESRGAKVKVAFVPPQEVYSEVDEKIVENEKAAVRDLMENEAEELEKFVNVSALKASDANWTYFKLMVAPRTSLAVVPKDVVVLIDASGSIGADRLTSCRLAAKGILRSCMNTGDRFNLVAFRDRFAYAFRTWQPCTQPSFDSADKWLANLAAHGRTDVFATIRSVLTLPRDPQRPLIALVVTDGDANAGVSETAQILSKFTALNDGLISIYMYGVKGSANRELIDVLTHGNRGESFIYGGSRWRAGSKIESLSERFRDPVLSDLRVIFPAASRAEAYPRLLKNLYRGDTVEIVGRVPKAERNVTVSISGLHGPKPYGGFFKVNLDTVAEDPAVVKLFAEESAIDAKLR